VKNLADHILDIAQNSTRAGAAQVEIALNETDDEWIIQINDDGCGMNEETLQKVTDPFFTSRTTRKVGLGIPFFKMSAEQTDGSLSIHSKVGQGTSVTGVFKRKHIDCPPIGDLQVTVALLITGHPDVELIFTYNCKGEEFSLRTSDVKEALGDMDLRMPKVSSFLKDMIKENLIHIGVDLE
jgi:hypothetical protein